jgi:UDP-GlcNAc:undecaprenyl-phosphate/decaprenyl-phosphate GlcNAc-1-phosphate transferase
MLAEIFLSFLWALLISVFAMPSIIYVAESKRLLNFPNERTTHTVSVPRLGGLAIFAGFLSSVMIFGTVNHEVQYLLAGCITLFYIAVKDDLVTVSAFKKFFVQILATGILVFLGDYRITNFHGLLGIHELSMGTSYAFTMVTVIAITNSVNLIDGINGLAGSLVVLALGLIFCTLYYVQPGGPLLLVAVALAGAVLGFLRYNFGIATIFMGDAGSLICGFVLAALLVRFVEVVPFQNAPILAMSAVFVPIVDTLRVTFVRLLDGRSPFSSDKNHIHHKLLHFGFSNSAIVAILCGLNMFAYLSFLFLSELDVNLCLLIFVTLLSVSTLVFHLLKAKPHLC